MPPSSEKADKLKALAGTLKQRFGKDAIKPLSEVSEGLSAISTQFSLLDKALGIGGIPRKRITEIIGVPTSGMSTLALRIIGSAQANGDMAVYIDMARTFDGDYAIKCRVQLDRLLVCRPKDHALGLSIAQDLIASGGVGVLVFDLGLTPVQDALLGDINHLLSILAKSPCALIVLSSVPSAKEHHTPLAYYASIRLRIEKERWLRRRNDVHGYRSKITVLKNKLAQIARPVLVTIHFEGVSG